MQIEFDENLRLTIVALLSDFLCNGVLLNKTVQNKAYCLYSNSTESSLLKTSILVVVIRYFDASF